MAQNSDRESYFPKIEARYGQPMKYWFEVMRDIKEWKYPQQISFLKEEHGFSQAHANALVMYSRGSKSAKRFQTITEYLATEEKPKQKTIKSIMKVISSKYPKTNWVISWNHPMLKYGDKYIFGISTAKSHILLAPFDPKILRKFATELKDYKVNKKTFQVPVDWNVDNTLLLGMIREALKK